MQRNKFQFCVFLNNLCNKQKLLWMTKMVINKYLQQAQE